jgi:protein SCO1/2
MGHPARLGRVSKTKADEEGMELMESLMPMRRSGLRAMKALAAAALFCAVVPSMHAQVSSYGDKETGPANDKAPSILSGVGIAQNLNAQLPLSLTFTDDDGKQVPLANYFGRKPAILALVYYQCPMLCSEELNGLTGALQMVDEVPGKDFNVVVVSIDPSEGTDLAAAKKRSYLKRYGHPETADGWHFMTGTQANIDALTKAVGFGYVKIAEPAGTPTQYAHASSIQIVTPEGKLAQYYMGVEYSPKDLRLGLAEAASHRIGSPVDNILTYCYHYDPGTNKHSLIVARVIQLGGLVTVCSLGGFMLVMFRKDIRNAAEATPTATAQAHSAPTGTANNKGKGTKVNG